MKEAEPVWLRLNMRSLPGCRSGAVFSRYRAAAVGAGGQIRGMLIRGLMHVRGPGYANDREHDDQGCKAPTGIVVGWNVSVYVVLHRCLVGLVRGEQE